MASTEQPAEGYDPDIFVKTVSDRLICPVCHLVMADPRVVETCGHHFCSSCLQKVKRSTGLCPLDQEEIGQTFKDKGRMREIQGLKCHCVKSRKGCDWIGELRDFEDHVEKQKCFLLCESGCGNKVRIFEMENHVEKTCPETVVDCPFKMVGDGCNFKAKRAEINDHVKTNQLEHILLGATAFTNMQKYIWKEAIQPTKSEDRNTTFDWIIYDFAEKKQQVDREEKYQVSDKFYTGPCNTGYCLSLHVHLNGYGSFKNTHVSIFVAIWSGRNDATLAWPFCHKIELKVLNSKTKATAVKKSLGKNNYPLDYREKPASGAGNTSYGFLEFLDPVDLSAFSILATNRLHVCCIVDWTPWE